MPDVDDSSSSEEDQDFRELIEKYPPKNPNTQAVFDQRSYEDLIYRYLLRKYPLKNPNTSTVDSQRDYEYLIEKYGQNLPSDFSDSDEDSLILENSAPASAHHVSVAVGSRSPRQPRKIRRLQAPEASQSSSSPGRGHPVDPAEILEKMQMVFEADSTNAQSRIMERLDRRDLVRLSGTNRFFRNFLRSRDYYDGSIEFFGQRGELDRDAPRYEAGKPPPPQTPWQQKKARLVVLAMENFRSYLKKVYAVTEAPADFTEMRNALVKIKNRHGGGREWAIYLNPADEWEYATNFRMNSDKTWPPAGLKLTPSEYEEPKKIRNRYAGSRYREHAELRIATHRHLDKRSEESKERPIVVSLDYCIFCALQLAAMGEKLVHGYHEDKLEWYRFSRWIFAFPRLRAELWGTEIENEFRSWDDDEKREFINHLVRKTGQGVKPDVKWKSP